MEDEKKLDKALETIEKRTPYRIGYICRKVPCHKNTILNYEKAGFISPERDHHGHRIFTYEDILKIKAVLAVRKPVAR